MESKTGKPQVERILSQIEGQEAGYVEYQVAHGVMDIQHTIVRPEFGGKGIGSDLIRQSVELAKEKGWKIQPSCSFAYGYFQRHPELQSMVIMDAPLQNESCPLP
jgi:predicted GNAT family acetyltransferase